MKLNCTACNAEQSMEATKIPKFSSIVRLIGYIIVTPSVLLIAILTLSMVNIANSGGSSESTGLAIGMVLFMIAGALVASLIGWLLLMKKKVYKCVKCGFVLDRA